MRATSAPSNLQGQRQPVINCCVHKCKWVRWGSKRERKKTAVRPIFQQGAICERGKWFRGQRTNLLLRKAWSRRMWAEARRGGGGGRQEWLKKTNRKICGGNKYQMFYFDLLLPHMSTICIHKRNQTYSLSPLPSPPRPTLLRLVAPPRHVFLKN